MKNKLAHASNLVQSYYNNKEGFTNRKLFMKLLVTSIFCSCAAKAQTLLPGPQPAAMLTLPVGSVLMFDKAPDPLPLGWEKCGYIRVEQSEKEADKPYTDHNYICVHKVS